MENVRRKIRESLDGAKNPALLCSFGKDSLLLLHLALQIYPNLAIIWYKHRANKEQRRFAERIIQEWDLTVLSYSPADTYFLPGDSLTLVDEMSFGPHRLPLLTDTKQGTECAVTLKGERTPFFGYDFDVTLWGYKRSDEVGPLFKTPFAEDFKFGVSRFVAPLYDLTDGEVLRAIEECGIPYEAVDDSVSVCTNCLTSDEPVYCPEAQSLIDPIVWDKGFALETFKQRFN